MEASSEVEKHFKSEITLKTSKFDFGITAGNNFLSVEIIKNGELQEFKIDEKRANFFAKFDFPNKTLSTSFGFYNKEKGAMNSLLYDFKFDSINFVNLWKDSVLVSYNHSPRGNVAICHFFSILNMPWKKLQIKPIRYLMTDCSAIVFDCPEDELPALETMLKLSNVSVTKIDFGIRIQQKYPKISDQDPRFQTDYDFKMVKYLGYPGEFMMQLHGCLGRDGSKKHLLQNIWYHVMQDRSLRSCVVNGNDHSLAEDSNTVFIRKVIITPTKKIFTPPTPTCFCHIFRIVDHEKVIEVSFERDGEGGNNLGLPALAAETCANGIDICGEMYHELGCSNSKFRECGSYFYRGSKEEILQILKSLGKFDRALPAKIAARIGLNFTSSIKGVFIPECSFTTKSDLTSANGKYNFTDGCGQMSSGFALEMKKHLKLKHLPSAIQFRLPGHKGVLRLDDQLKDDFPVLRESQKKFDPPLDKNNYLDVVKVSGPAGCRLNKNLIEILCQNAAKHGDDVKTRVFNRINNYYVETLDSAIDEMIDPEKFTETLESLPKYMDYSQMKSYTPESFQSEPFLRQMVQADALVKLKFLHEKKQIKLPTNVGRTAIGVADFRGYLKPGQVFFQYSKNVNVKCKEKLVHVGPIAITRSPMYSLGDIRFVQAVDCPELHHLVDVLVFPVCGDRPIQDEISGGDLDGDEYVVFWDPELMLPSSQPAAEFVHPKPQRQR